MEREVPDYILDEEKRIERRKAHQRRNFLKKSFAWLIGLMGSIAYLKFEANWLEVTRKRVLLPTLKNKNPIRLLHLSDLHFSSRVSLQEIEIAMREGFALTPDACVITGDFITDQQTNQELEEFSKLLAKFARNVPIFASLGNHDGGEWAGTHGGYLNSNKVQLLLKNAGIKLLDSLNWHGLAMAEYKKDEKSDKFKLIEINPKIWGSFELSIKCGVDFINDLISLAEEKNITQRKNYALNKRFQWVFSYKGDLERLKQRKRDFFYVIADIFNPWVFNEISFKDFKPNFLQIKACIKKLIKP